MENILTEIERENNIREIFLKKMVFQKKNLKMPFANHIAKKELNVIQ